MISKLLALLKGGKGLIIASAAGALILAVLLGLSYKAGYNSCSAKQAQAVAEQELDDAESLSKIKEKAHDRIITKTKIQYVIKAVPDPSGCADTFVPVGRTDRMREFYRGETEPGIDKGMPPSPFTRWRN